MTAGLSPQRQELLGKAWQVGVSFDDFVAALPASSLGRDDFLRSLDLSGAELVFRELHDLRVLAIVEDWCKDSRDSLPVLAALMGLAKDSELRIVRRDDHADLMREYLTEGFASIPVFIFMDRSFSELERYIERPRSVARLRRADREELASRDSRFAPAEAKVTSFPEPVRSELREQILVLRQRSLQQATVLVANELAAVGERVLQRIEGADLLPASSMLVSSSSGQFPSLQIIDVGDDDCEVESPE